ncbi:methyltransferase domain-containing protein [Methylobacillus flagellatus]|uniref:class I SAM-dependent methyltransferase n=1 Tax=Methylobacillus flagellatus TaxID=405 RepID=UPI00285393BA|nr:methyltransferase domain-containing protein [Methylobacillus flagellatus]MDR5171357.1 methyltransferase domain-containing protein [Methylobacillus flagellatus]
MQASCPSAWLVEHSHYIKPGGRVLDVASGAGRNAVWLARQGFRVTAVDRDAAALATLKSQAPDIEVQARDLEQGAWPYVGEYFDAIVVCRYLYRPLLPVLADSLAAQGVLIYETFMQGHEQYGRPSNPDFLLRSNELADTFKPLLRIAAYEEGLLQLPPNPAVLQRLVALAR